MDAPVRVVYACDENYAALAVVSAVSLLRHNPGAKVAVLGYGLSASTEGDVRNRVERAGGSFLFADVTKEIDDIASSGVGGYTSFSIFSRFFIGDVLQDSGRVLYLDCDTLVRESLNDLFHLRLDGRPFALGCDCIPNRYHGFMGIGKEDVYFNSGVMLIDLKEWRNRMCKERALEEIENPHGPNPLPDQDIINRVFRGEIKTIPPKWNCLSQFFMLSYDGLARIVSPQRLPFTRAEYDLAVASPAVCHFSGHTLGRPWYVSSKHPMREEYRKAAGEAGFPAVAEQVKPMPAGYKVQYWLWRILPQRLFDIACRMIYRINLFKTYRI